VEKVDINQIFWCDLGAPAIPYTTVQMVISDTDSSTQTRKTDRQNPHIDVEK
jgi:hypothetical protein